MTEISIKLKTATDLFSVSNTENNYFSQEQADVSGIEQIITNISSSSNNNEKDVKINITVDDKQGKSNDQIIQAIKFYCQVQIAEKLREVNDMKSKGKTYTYRSIIRVLLILLLSTLVAAVLTAIKLDLLLPYLGGAVAIIIWMFIWQPVELWTYDWWELADEANVLKRISNSTINVN